MDRFTPGSPFLLKINRAINSYEFFNPKKRTRVNLWYKHAMSAFYKIFVRKIQTNNRLNMMKCDF